eukprot:gene6333-7588_t
MADPPERRRTLVDAGEQFLEGVCAEFPALAAALPAIRLHAEAQVRLHRIGGQMLRVISAVDPRETDQIRHLYLIVKGIEAVVPA